MAINYFRAADGRSLRVPGQIRCQQFPQGRWIVAWLGDVDFHNRSRLSSQPTLSVVLANLDSAKVELTETHIAIAQLFAMDVGRVWEDKVRTTETWSSSEEREVEIDSTKAIECLAGIQISRHSSEFMLPFDVHPYHRAHTKAPCVQVEADGCQWIFPALELTRFYFGSSGQLLKKIFRPDFNRASVVTDFKLGNRGSLRIDLVHDIKAFSAADVARLVVDDVAMNAAKLVSRSLVEARAGGHEKKIYPRTTFPFRGKSRILLRGLPIASDEGGSRFLVQEILSCGFPFPFQHLDYVSTTPNLSQASAASVSTHENQHERRVSRRDMATNTSLKSEEPKKSSAAVGVVLDRSVRFPDLLKKSICRGGVKPPSRVMVSRLAAIEEHATGQGRSTGTAQSIDPIAANDARSVIAAGLTSPHEVWQVYFDFLAALAQCCVVESMAFVPYDPRQFRPYHGPIPELVDEDGLIIGSTLRRPFSITEGIDLDPPREASFLNVFVHKKWFGIFSVCPPPGFATSIIEVWIGPDFWSMSPLKAITQADSGVGSWHSLALQVDSSGPKLNPAEAFKRVQAALANSTSDPVRPDPRNAADPKIDEWSPGSAAQ